MSSDRETQLAQAVALRFPEGTAPWVDDGASLLDRHELQAAERRLIRSFELGGSPRVDLVVHFLHCNQPWIFPIAGSSRSSLLLRFEKELMHWRQAQVFGGAHARALMSRIETSIGADANFIAQGMMTTGRWSESRPTIVILLETLGRSARPRIHRLAINHDDDVSTKFAQLRELHICARQAVENNRMMGAAAMIDANAARVIEVCVLSLSQIINTLERFAEAPFAASDGSLTGKFRWDGFRIVVDLEHGSGWQLCHDRLRIADAMIPSALQAAAVGKRLGRIVEVELLDGDSIIETLTIQSDGMLEITLRPSSIHVGGNAIVAL